jgi:hypothetical protein
VCSGRALVQADKRFDGGIWVVEAAVLFVLSPAEAFPGCALAKTGSCSAAAYFPKSIGQFIR